MSGLGKAFKIKEISEYPAGCGWWCRRTHDFLDIATAYSPLASVAIWGVFKVAKINPDFAFKGKLPTIQGTDEYMFNTWLENLFYPWYTTLVERFEVALQSTDNNYKLEIYNQFIKEFCIIQSYYDGFYDKSTVGSSIEYRNALFTDFFPKFNEIIATELAKIPNLTSVATKFGFETIPFLVARNMNPNYTGVMCHQYAQTNVKNETVVEISPVFTQPSPTVIPAPAQTFPPRPTPTITEVFNAPILGNIPKPTPTKPIETGEPIANPIIIDPIKITTPPIETTLEKPKNSNWWLWLAIAYGGYKILK